jgi:UDP-glucose 4-epimerase
VFDNESLGKRAFLEGLNATFVSGDLRDPEAVSKALRGQEGVVHLAADTQVIPSIKNPRHNFEVNVFGTLNLMDAMREHGITQMASASTGGAILGEVPPPVHEGMVPQPTSPYGASKLAVEGYASAYGASYGLNTVSLRFSNVYGPRSFHKGSVVAAFFKNILAGRELVVYGDGSQTRDYVFVEDLCEGIRRGLELDHTEVLQLGTGIPTSVNKLIDTMRATVGERDVTVRYEPARNGEVMHTYCNISKAREVIGYNPQTTLADGLAKAWTWFTENQSRFS